MSKYGDFEVVRTEKRLCKRTNDPNADEHGMREYSYLRCPHCKKDDIAILTSTLRTNKSLIIREHIAECAAFEGQRPEKRCKEAATAKANKLKLLDNDNATLESKNTQMELEKESLESKIAQLDCEKESLESKKRVLHRENADLKSENEALRSSAKRFCEEEMYNCFFDLGVGVDPAVVEARMNASAKEWGRLRQKETLRSLGLVSD